MIQGSQIMRLFKSTKDTKTGKASSGLNNRSAIGVDISQHAIKMVQLTGRSLNQIQLEKYVITKLPKNIVKGNKIQDYDQLATYIQHTYTQITQFLQKYCCGRATKFGDSRANYLQPA